MVGCVLGNGEDVCSSGVSGRVCTDVLVTGGDVLGISVTRPKAPEGVCDAMDAPDTAVLLTLWRLSGMPPPTAWPAVASFLHRSTVANLS